MKLCPYKLHNISLTKVQLAKLVEGRSVRFNPDQMVNGEHLLPLTKTQINRLKKAQEKECGALLRISSAQTKYARIHCPAVFTALGVSPVRKRKREFIQRVTERKVPKGKSKTLTLPPLKPFKESAVITPADPPAESVDAAGSQSE